MITRQPHLTWTIRSQWILRKIKRLRRTFPRPLPGQLLLLMNLRRKGLAMLCILPQRHVLPGDPQGFLCPGNPSSNLPVTRPLLNLPKRRAGQLELLWREPPPVQLRISLLLPLLYARLFPSFPQEILSSRNPPPLHLNLRHPSRRRNILPKAHRENLFIPRKRLCPRHHQSVQAFL